MTAREESVIKSLTDSFHTLREEVHLHIQHTDDTFNAFKTICDERHGLHPGRLSKLEDAALDAKGERTANTATLKTLFTVAGWGVALLSVAISLILHFA